MKTLTVQLPDETAAGIEEAAGRLGISAEALIRASVEEKLERLNAGFEDAARHVLRKNEELYRRLA